MKKTRAALFACIALGARTSSAVELILNPSPQVTKDTCQSYQIAFALAATGDPAYRAETSNELRKMESDFRSALVSTANAAPDERKGKTSDHVNWQEAVKSYTSGKYVLRDKYFKTLGEIYAAVAEKTGNSNVQAPGAILSVLTARQPVFTSVQSVAGSAYGAGHIVAVFGVSAPTNMSPGPQTKLPLAILNSAIKLGKGTGNMCHMAEGDDKYRAEVYLTVNYELKQFQNLGYDLLWLERAPHK
jgi:hypothetical protein